MANKETLDDIARDPGCAEALSAGELHPLLAKAALVRGALRSHWSMVSVRDAPGRSEGPDRLLTGKETAPRLGISCASLSIHADEYPFTRRVLPHRRRFSERGIEEWLRSGPRVDRRTVVRLALLVAVLAEGISP